MQLKLDHLCLRKSKILAIAGLLSCVTHLSRGIASDIEEDSQAMGTAFQAIQEERDLAQALALSRLTLEQDEQPSKMKLEKLPEGVKVGICNLLNFQSLYSLRNVNTHWKKVIDPLLNDYRQKDKVQWNDRNSTLKELEEENNRMNPYDEEEVYFSFSSYPLSLRTTLSLSKGLLGKQGGNILGQFLKETKTLQELCLTEIDDSEGFEGLIEGLKENETLQNVELNRMSLSVKEFEELSKSLKGKRELIKLEFNFISPRDKGAYFDLLSSFLHIPMQEEEGEEWGIRKQNEEPNSKHFLPNLKYLSFSNCKLKKSAASYLKYFIRNSSNLQKLHLEGNYLGKCWIREINPALESSQIRILNLQANKIGSKGCKWLLQALPNTHITSLNLADNKIGNKGLKLLPQALKLSRNLTRLDLSNNKLNDKATPYISQALEETPSLQFLNLEHNKIEDAGATSIASNLDRYQTLILLNLLNNKIGNAGFISFCLNIHKNHQIQHISLRYPNYCYHLEDGSIHIPSLWEFAFRAFPILEANTSI